MRPRAAFDLSLAAVLGLFLAACWFAHPTADDFIYAANAQSGWWGAWLREYAGWNGRYASNALVLATPLRFGLAAYRAAVAGAILTIPLATWVLVRAWRPTIAARDALTCVLAFSALYLSHVPSIGEAVYWYTSAATYQLWIVPAAIYAWLIRSAVRGRRLALVPAALMLVVIAGFNEVAMLILAVLHALWLWTATRDEDADRTMPALMLAAIVVGGLLVLLAPGNAVRQSEYVGVRHELGRSLFWTLLQTLRFGATWVASGPLLLATVLFVSTIGRWRESQGAAVRSQRWWPALAVGMLILIPAATFPAYWETGTLGQHRTVDVAYFVFLVLWFVAAGLWADGASPAARTLREFGEAWRLPLAAAFVAGVAFTANGYEVGSDLASRRLARFDAELTERYAQLDACRRRQAPLCEVPPLADKPESFAFTDVSPNPSNFVNAAYARYFHAPAVQADVRH